MAAGAGRVLIDSVCQGLRPFSSIGCQVQLRTDVALGESGQVTEGSEERLGVSTLKPALSVEWS